MRQTIKDIHRIFYARSVAVVGASGDPRKFGYMTLNSIIEGGYEGRIYPVNPKGGEILGQTVYPSLSEVPGDVDLVVIVVPAKFVPGLVREAAEKGAAGVLIHSTGFREAGRADLEEEIRSISEATGIRVLGPNIQGINYLPHKLCAMFFPVITQRGPVAFITQSGSVTAALTEWADAEGLGISAAVNLGNQVDLCETDYIEFFADDEHTKAIALYIEGVKDGRRFLETIRRARFKKPIVILKAGRTDVGQQSAASHTGSLAGSHDVFAAACRQYGVISTESIDALYDCAKAVAAMRPPKGNRVLSISTSGGMGTLAADAAESLGLVLPPLSHEFIEEFKRSRSSALANLKNPLDMTYVPSEYFEEAALLADQLDVADVILINLGDPVPGMIEVVKNLNAKMKTSLVVNYLGGGEEEKKGKLEIQKAGIPVFPSPERAMRGIAAAVDFTRFSQTHELQSGTIPLAIRNRDDTADMDRSFILEPEAVKYLEQYNIPYPEHGPAQSAEEAVEIADRLKYPVVLKIVSADVPHKSDSGGVITGLENADQVNDAFGKMLEGVKASVPNAKIEGVLVCKQAAQGLEVIVGATDDPVFGPTIMFGLGGIFAEILKDVSFRIAPLERKDAEEMIREIKGYPMLAGARGQSGYDIDQLTELLLSVSQLVTDHPTIKELDLNPVRLFGKGLMALDVRIIETKSFAK